MSLVNGVTLFLNVLACVALFVTDPTSGVNLGLSLVWLLLFTPCSFLCWYRPVYKAFRYVNAPKIRIHIAERIKLREMLSA